MSLWKYMDLAKFTALLQKESLHFCRGDKFADPFEGSYPLSAIDAFGVFQESCRLKLKFMPPFFPQDPVLVFLD